MLIAIAATTAIRPSEMVHLLLKDVHLDAEDPYIVIRFGRKGKATKSGNIRRVSLLPGVGLDAFRRWLETLPTYCPENTLGLAFPYPSGAKRQVGGSKFFHSKKNLWREYLTAAGIEREVRFYDLRHTSASSLVAGFWGRRWSLEEIMEHLGHSTPAMSKRYARILARRRSSAPLATPTSTLLR